MMRDSHKRFDPLFCTAAALAAAVSFCLGQWVHSLWLLPLLCAASAAAALLLLRHRSARESQLEERSLRDSLTGFYHHRATEELVNRALDSAQEGERHTLVLFDVDNFKSVNDVYGHTFGDLVLIEFSALLKAHTGRLDILGRSGGDEFILLMAPRLDPDAVNETLDRLYTKLSHTSFGQQQNLRISVSAGLAFSPDHGTTYAELFGAADQALYYAKAHGKNFFCTAGELHGEGDCYVSQRDLAHLVDFAADGIVKLAALEDRLLPLYFNAPFLSLTGLAPEHLAGGDLLALAEAQDQETLMAAFQAATAARQPFGVTVRLRCAGGVRTVSLRCIFLSELWEGQRPVIFAALSCMN